MKTTILLVLGLITLSCSSQKWQCKSNVNFNEISFGSGGGFTGLQSNYLLNSGREVFKSEGGELKKINRISKKERRNIAGIITKIDFYNIKISENGNMTYFIEIKGNESVNKVTWSDNSQTPELKEFYKTLAETLKP